MRFLFFVAESYQIMEGDDAELEWEEEEELLDQDEVFDLLLMQQVEANRSAQASSEQNIAKVVERVRGHEDRAKAKQLDREAEKRRREDDLVLLKAKLVARVAICLQLNQGDLGVADDMGEAVPTIGGLQRFIGKFRASFRQVQREEDRLVLEKKQGTELQLCQVLMQAIRTQFMLPCRLVVRVQSEFDPSRDVWLEVLVDDRWHRAFASVARVVREEEAHPNRPVGKLLGKLDPSPLRTKVQDSSQFVLGLGERNHLTVVTKRYFTLPSKRVDDFVQQVAKDWNLTLVGEAGDYFAHTWSKPAIERELALLDESNQIPTTRAEFSARGSEFVLKSDLGEFRFVKPGEKPIDFYKGEAVYRKRDQVGELLTEYMWRRRGRRVADGAEPAKVVGEEEQKQRRLFALDQTEAIDFGEVGEEDGAIPTNEFGNVESWGLPRNSVHVQLPLVERACEVLGIPYAPCVVGFERHSSSAGGDRVKPRFDGVVVASQNELLLRAQVEHLQHEAKLDREKEQHEAVLAEWRRLLEANWTVATSNLGRFMATQEEE